MFPFPSSSSSSSLLSVLFLWLASFVVAGNVTITPDDPSVTFLQQWDPDLLRTNSQGTVLTVTLPANATSFTYFGSKFQKGSLYGICIDCQSDNYTLNVVDGTDSTLPEGSPSEPTGIVTMSLNANETHELTLMSIPDDRAGSTSSVSFSSITVITSDVTPPSSPIPVTITPTSTLTEASPSTSTFTTNPNLPSTNTPAGATSSISFGKPSSTLPGVSSSSLAPSRSSDASSNRLNTAMIAGVVSLCVVAAVALLIASLFYINIRKRRIEQRRLAAENDLDFGTTNDLEKSFVSPGVPTTIVQPPDNGIWGPQEVQQPEQMPPFIATSWPPPPPVDPYAPIRSAIEPTEIGTPRPMLPPPRVSSAPRNIYRHAPDVPRSPLPSDYPMIEPGPSAQNTWLSRRVNYDINSRPPKPRSLIP